MRAFDFGKRMMDYNPRPDLLQDRVILVTGAGQGLGRTAALTFAQHGATVILLGRNQKRLDKVYDEIVAAGHAEPMLLSLDLAKATDAEFDALAQAVFDQLGRLDGILHNAAHFEGLLPFEHHSLDQWLKMLRTNLAAPATLTRACLPLLLRAPDASIVWTSETHGQTPAAYWGAYAVSKSALHTLITIWSQELSVHTNLRMNGLIPGPVNTAQRRMSHPAENPARLAEPEALMPLYLYLMGPDSCEERGKLFDAQAI